MNLRRAISAVFVSTFALAGCSTSYAPRPNPRVAVVMQGGTPVYIREGRVFPGGGFGGDLREAVQGNPEAEAHAKSYRTGMIAGVTTTLAGIASAIGGGALYFANSTGPENERDGTSRAVGGTLALSGIAAYATGMVLLLNAQPHLWDSINAYNDGVENGAQRAYGTHVTPAPTAGYASPLPMNTAPAESKSKALPPPVDEVEFQIEETPTPAAPPAAPALPPAGTNTEATPAPPTS